MVRTRGSAAKENGGSGNASEQQDASVPVPLAEDAPLTTRDENVNSAIAGRNNVSESDLSDSNDDTASSGYRVSGESIRSAAARPRAKKKTLGMKRRLSDGAGFFRYRAPYASVGGRRQLSLSEAPPPSVSLPSAGSIQRIPSLLHESTEREELQPRPFHERVQSMIDELGGGVSFQLEGPSTSAAAAAAMDRVVVDPWSNEKVIATLKSLEALHNAEISRAKMHQWCSVCEERADYSCCWNVSYCSRKCQEDDWEDGGHKLVCRR